MKDKSDGRPLPPTLRKRKPEKNEVRFGARALLFRMSGVDLTQLEAISETTALVVLSELGIDMSAFPHEDEPVVVRSSGLRKPTHCRATNWVDSESCARAKTPREINSIRGHICSFASLDEPTKAAAFETKSQLSDIYDFVNYLVRDVLAPNLRITYQFGVTLITNKRNLFHSPSS